MNFANKALKNVTFAPFWLDSQESPELCDSLSGQCETDLLIVGGGFTGLWVAIQAKEENPQRKVILIEAKHVGVGASGRPGGIVSSSLLHDIENVKRTFPEEANEIYKLGVENLSGFEKDINRFDIQCDLEFGGELTVAVSDDGLPRLVEELENRKEFNSTAEVLDSKQTQEQINSPIFKGALWVRDRSGTVHPGKLVLGLKETALGLGVEIYENTALQSVKRNNKQLVVTTENGEITARKVLLATNAFSSGHRRIKNRVVSVIDRVLATEPLTSEQLDSLGWKNRQGVYDNRSQLNYMRLTEDNRIIFGGRLTYRFANSTNTDLDKVKDPFIRLAEAFITTFPQLSEVKFSNAWSGPIALTTRKAVHYQRYHHGDMFYVGGYSGFGVSASRFGARIGLALLDGKNIPETKMGLAVNQPRLIPPEPFRWIGSKITMYALDTADEKGGWRNIWIHLVEKMGFPLH